MVLSHAQRPTIPEIRDSVLLVVRSGLFFETTQPSPESLCEHCGLVHASLVHEPMQPLGVVGMNEHHVDLLQLVSHEVAHEPDLAQDTLVTAEIRADVDAASEIRQLFAIDGEPDPVRYTWA